VDDGPVVGMVAPGGFLKVGAAERTPQAGRLRQEVLLVDDQGVVVEIGESEARGAPMKGQRKDHDGADAQDHPISFRACARVFTTNPGSPVRSIRAPDTVQPPTKGSSARRKAVSRSTQSTPPSAD